MAKKQSHAVKGTHVITSKAWVDERLGEGAFDKLSSEFESSWGIKLLPSTWYDIFSLMRVMEPACKKIGSSILDAYSEIAAKNAKDDLTTIYRAFLRLAGSRGLLNATPSLWRNYISFGEVEKITNEPGLHISVCRGIPVPVLEWACGSWAGFIPTAIEVSGGKDAKLVITDTGVDTKTQGDMDFSYLRAEVTYKP